MTDLQTRAEAIATDAHSMRCSSLFWSLRHEMLAVVRAAKATHQSYVVASTSIAGHKKVLLALEEALAAYDDALQRELGGEP